MGPNTVFLERPLGRLSHCRLEGRAPSSSAVSTLPLSPAAETWFTESFAAPTPVQLEGWARIANGEHALLIAPTGSGKTLAAFLSCIDRLSRDVEERKPSVRVLYVSPLKALVYDVERNLRAPLVGIDRVAARLGAAVKLPSIGVRTGDTTMKERRQQLKDPPSILVTTPESLYLMLGSQMRDTLRTVDTIIVDEVHALAPTKRGAHLALSLERLAALTERDPQRIGLSATARPASEVARYLGGDRPVSIVDTSVKPNIDLQIVVPVEDMSRPGVIDPSEPKIEYVTPIPRAASGEEAFTDADAQALLFGRPKTATASIWPAIHPRLLELIRAHRTTIVFVNSRGLCERLAQRLNDLAGEPLVRAHHGSIAHPQRREIEEALKNGQIRGIVATSSLELGIDMGSVDLVVLVESPGSVASGLQRVGRAGHQVGATSKGRIFPKHRGDLLEATVVAKRMEEGDIEPLRVPSNTLDVLAQHIVAMTALDPQNVTELEKLVRRASSFRELPRDAYLGVLDMLAGRYPSTELADLRPRIVWDRDADTIRSRKGSRTIALTNGGTIPDRGLYTVHLGHEGPRVGELDEEMVHETQAGQTITLGASTWRIIDITRDRVIVEPAPGEIGKLPFWKGEGVGRPIDVGRAIGAMTAKIGGMKDDAAFEMLTKTYRLDHLAARNLIAYIREQHETTGTLPTDRSITIERFRDELGDYRVCILTPFGARVHAPWALALEAMLARKTGAQVQTLYSDDGIVVRFADSEDAPPIDSLIPEPEDIESLVVEQLGHSALFGTQFRENAARALLLPRKKPGQRTPLWAQRLRSQHLLAVTREYPSFPIVMETNRTCLQDVFDLPALIELLHAIRKREVRTVAADTASASPFARSLVFTYVAAYMYEADAPLAERKAHALALDRKLLRELLGEEALRDLLDSAVIDELEAELQWLADDRRARDADELHDMLRRLGALTRAEIEQRSAVSEQRWLDELLEQRRAFRIRVAGDERFIALEDVALYRDGLGVAPPPGVPTAVLGPVEHALASLIRRFARTRGPFQTSELLARYRPSEREALTILEELERSGDLVRGELRPGASGREWCDAEVLRRIKRRTLAKLRNEVAPVERAVLARFVPAWHGLGDGHARSLEEIVAQLEGLPLPYGDLERAILPARMPNFHPRMLDELGASGAIVWVGHGSLGSGDGRVALYRRERAARLLELPAAPPVSELGAKLLEHLTARGASFFAELHRACGDAERAEVIETLWDLVWAGLVTNDTLAPLRALKLSGGKERGKQKRESMLVSGRWSLVAPLIDPKISPTERAHARAVMLLERHGILSREAAGIEALPGGFSAVYRVLRSMEEAGKARRGHFVEGLEGAQFALPGAVDRLRSMRKRGDDPDVRVLAAVDPANPYGWLVPWPERVSQESQPKRASGASLVLVDGEPVLYVERGERSVISFEAAQDETKLGLAFSALKSIARRSRGRMLRLETVDGEAARKSRLASFTDGVTHDHRALVVEA